LSEVFEITESSLFMSVDIALASFLSSTTLPTKDFNSDTDPFTSMDVLCKVGDLSVEAVEFDEVVDEVVDGVVDEVAVEVSFEVVDEVAVEVSFEVVDGVVDEVAVEVSFEVVDGVAVEVSFEVVDGVVDEVAVEVSVPPLLPIEVLVLDVEL